MEEREISIVDLMVEILLHWRMFIIWMIVGAVLLGAFSYVRSGSAAKQQQAQNNVLEQAPEDWLTDEEIQNVNYVLGYEKAYLEKTAYQEKSAVMQIDSNNVNKAEATICIESDEYQRGCEIEKVYEDIASSGALIAKVAEDNGMETVGISDVLLVYSERNIVNSSTGGNTFNANSTETNTFKIAAVHSDEETCKNMLESAVAYLKEKHSDIENVLGEHDIIVANESFGVVSDMEIANMQKTVLDNIAAMKKVLADAKDGLSDAEQKYYAILTSDALTEEAAQPAEIPSPGISKKYVLLGAVMAAFLYAFILLLIYIFNTKLRATDNLQELYNIPQFGIIPAENSRKKFLGVVDKWVLSIRDRNKRQFTPDEALELASVAAKMAAGKEELREICLIGCGLKERSLEVCEKIKASLEKESVRVNILNNVLYDARMMEELEKAKGAVLVESVGSTLYNEVAEELKLLQRQGIKVLGGILVG